MTISRLLDLGSKDGSRNFIPAEKKLKPDRCRFMFYNPIVAWEGKSKNLLPYYYYAYFMLRWTIHPNKGDSSALHVFTVNLLNRFAPGGRPFNIFDYIWNDLRRMMDDSRKHLPYAPYIMYMIERVTKTTFPKDTNHEPLHLHSRGEDAPPPPRHGGPSSSAPSYVEHPRRSTPSYAPSPSHCCGNGSMVKRVLRSIFCIRKTMVREVNENRHDIIET
jgi:hypothetical protein